MSLRTLIITSVIGFVRTLDSDVLLGTEKIAIYGLMPLETWQFFTLIWICISITALTGYLYYRSIFQVTRIHMEDVFGRIINKFGLEPELGKVLQLTYSEQNDYLKLALKSVRMVNILLRIILFSTFEIIVTAVCFIIILYINWKTTVLLTVCILLFIPLFYILSMSGLRERRALSPALVKLNTEIRTFGKVVTTTPKMIPETKKKFLSGETLKTAFDLFQTQRLIVFKSELAGGIMFATILIISLVWFQYLSRTSELDFLTTYLGILMVMTYSLARTTRSITSSNRFIDSAGIVKRFLSDSKKSRFNARIKRSALENPSSLIYQTKVNQDAIALGPSDILLYVHNRPVDPFYSHPLAASILPGMNIVSSSSKSARLITIQVHNSSKLDDIKMTLKEIGRVFEAGDYPIFEFIELSKVATEILETISTEFRKRGPILLATSCEIHEPLDWKNKQVVVWAENGRIVQDWFNNENNTFQHPIQVSNAKNSKTINLDSNEDDDEEFM